MTPLLVAFILIGLFVFIAAVVCLQREAQSG